MYNNDFFEESKELIDVKNILINSTFNKITSFEICEEIIKKKRNILKNKLLIIEERM